MWELDRKKAEHQRIDPFNLWWWRKLLRVPSILKEIKPANPKGNQPWMFTGRTDDEALILWPHDVKSWLTGKKKNLDAGKDWRKKETGAGEDERARQHHQLNGQQSKQTPGDSEEQGSLACCSSWGCRVGHDLATEQQQQKEIMTVFGRENRVVDVNRKGLCVRWKIWGHRRKLVRF